MYSDEVTAAANAKGVKVSKFLTGPLRSAALMGVGILGVAQLLDTGEKIGDRREAGIIRARDERNLKSKDKDMKQEQSEYDQMVLELYKHGYGMNFINGSGDNYFGYTPGLVDDPNQGLVQRMFDKRIGHTKM